MNDYNTIYALKVHKDWNKKVYDSLKNGEGRFGWSDIPNADLRYFQEQIKNGKALTQEEQDCAQWFLLDFKEGDYVVYINTPTYGECTLARVTGKYYWKHDDEDFNHRFHVDPNSVKTFHRNADIVYPNLKSRLKLQGRYWRIYAQKEFEDLLNHLENGKTGKPSTEETNLKYLQKEVHPLLSRITETIHKTHPNFDLENFCERIFRNIPGVKKVELKGRGGQQGDHGVDLLVHLEYGLPIPQLVEQKICLVQIKSFEGEHWDTQAVEDIRRGFTKHNEATMGLIISTAASRTPALDAALDKLREDEKGKRVDLLIGEDVAKLFLKYGADYFGLNLMPNPTAED